MSKQIEVVEKQIAYNGYFQMIRYHLKHTRFAGGWTGVFQREVFERGHAVAVLPYDPIRDTVVLIEQFRVGALARGEGAWLLEIIAGIIEPEETSENVAQREAQEEAGCEISDLIKICHYFASPGGTTETTQLFCARTDTRSVGGLHGLEEENEDIKVHVLTFDAAMALLEQGKLHSSPAIIALQWLALHRETVRQQWE